MTMSVYDARLAAEAALHEVKLAWSALESVQADNNNARLDGFEPDEEYEARLAARFDAACAASDAADAALADARAEKAEREAAEKAAWLETPAGRAWSAYEAEHGR